MKKWVPFIFLVSSLLSRDLFADDFYEVKSTQCKPFLFQNGIWSLAGSYPVNTRLFGKPHPQNKNSIIFHCGGLLCSYPINCLNQLESQSSSALRSPAEDGH